jgi:hypothetical protein
VEWNRLTGDRDQGPALLNIVMKIRSHKKEGISCINDQLLAYQAYQAPCSSFTL